jgi:endonuclease/exonuclease/phosphatase family metal-dependent hydrolase
VRPKSFPARFPLLALDRVWAGPCAAVADVRAHRSALALVASDHLPVVARLDPARALADLPVSS